MSASENRQHHAIAPIIALPAADKHHRSFIITGGRRRRGKMILFLELRRVGK